MRYVRSTLHVLTYCRYGSCPLPLALIAERKLQRALRVALR